MHILRRHTWQRYVDGQTLVLIALMLLVLFAILGLGVDVNNAYGQQRRDQQAANAAALAGMNAHVINKQTVNAPDNRVADAVDKALNDNRLENWVRLNYPNVAPNNQVTVWAEYLDKDGLRLKDVGAGTPDKAKAIRVTILDPVETYFARLVGRRHLNVKAVGYAQLCSSAPVIFPLTFDYNVIRKDPGNTSSTLVDPGDYVWVEAEVAGGNIGWINWTGANQSGNVLVENWRGGTPADEGSFVEGSHQAAPNYGPIEQIDKILQVKHKDPDQQHLKNWGDVVNGTAGVKVNNSGCAPNKPDCTGGLKQILAYHINHDQPGIYVKNEQDWTILTFPLFSSTNDDYGQTDWEYGPVNDRQEWTYGVLGDDKETPPGYVAEKAGANMEYKAYEFVSFRLVGYKLSQGSGADINGGDPYRNTTCGDRGGAPGFCFQFVEIAKSGEANVCLAAGPNQP